MKTRNKKFLVSTLLGATALCLVGGVAFIGAWEQSRETVARAETLESFKIQETAAVRRSEPNGIRFTTTVDSVTKAKAVALNNVTYGTIMLPADMLGDDEELTKETASVLDIPTVHWQNAEETEYTGVLAGSVDENGKITNLPESYYNRPIVARGYVTGTDSSGATVTYYTSNTAERSIGYVAKMAQLIDKDGSTLISNIVAETDIEVELPEELAMQTSAEEGIITNAITNTADAVLKFGGVEVNPEIFSEKGISYEISYTIGNEGVVSAENGGLKAAAQGSTDVKVSISVGEELIVEKTATLTVGNGFKAASDYVIIQSKNATARESNAAKLLQTVIKDASGVTLPIKAETGNEKTTDKYISVGETALAAANVTLSDGVKAMDTASVLQAVDNTLFICGTTEKGTLQGVQQYLGETFGYDYYLKDTYSFNTVTDAVALPDAAKDYIPDIEYNVIDRNDDIRENWGIYGYSEGVIPVGGQTQHNAVLILDPDIYYSSYADWYATETTTILWWENTELIKDNGGKAAELCYTAHGNDTAYTAMVNTVATAVADAIEAADDSRYRVGFSIMDGYYGWCNCDACSAGGNASDNLVNFLDDLCNKVEELLTTAGDSRADTFKLTTLAYHQTNVAPKNATSLNKHIELWFGDSYGDYTDGLKDSSYTKNQEIYSYFEGWSALTGEADMLIWLYYTNTKNGFVPYNTFTAIRENYAMAYEAGIDYVFNQTIQGRSVWTMLKHYLISKLAWNATPTDAEWNAWIDAYFEGAYGQGATAMQNWFNDWLDDSVSAYLTADGDPAIHRDMVKESNFSQETLEKWIGYADEAMAALDKNDPSYQQYYNNILLEKLSPEYLLIELYGKTSDYASEFVGGVNAWGITYLSELVKIDATLTEISASIDGTTVDEEFYAELQEDGTYSVTLMDGNIKAGTSYVLSGATATNTTAETEGQLTVSLASDVTLGAAQTVILTGNNYTITFPNVIAVTRAIETADELINDVVNGETTSISVSGTDRNCVQGYYVLANDIDFADFGTVSVANYNTCNVFYATFDGRGRTISNITAGMNGIFGYIYGATIKNVNFANAKLNSTYNYVALLGGLCVNSSITDVSVRYTEINVQTSEIYETGLLFSRSTDGNYNTWKNITLDATGLHVHSILGSYATFVNGTNKVIENVVVKADSYDVIGYSNFYKENEPKTAITAWPDGMTFIDTLESVEVSDKFIAEAGTVTLTNEAFAEGEIYDVTANGETVQAGVETAGSLTVVFETLTAGETHRVVCRKEAGDTDVAITFTNVFAITKYVKTVDDLLALQCSTSSERTLTGYYVLANDIDFSSAGTVAAGNYSGNYLFKGTFDGNGYKISNITVGTGGIFGGIENACIQNVNFTDVTLANAQYAALLAGLNWNSTIKNVTATYKAINVVNVGNVNNTMYYSGLLFGRCATDNTWENVTLDASDLKVPMVFGGQTTFTEDSKNVTIKMKSYDYIGYTDWGGTTLITEWPEWISVEVTVIEVAVDTEFYAETATNTALVESEYFAVGDTYTVSVNGEETTATVTTAGQLEFSFTSLEASTGSGLNTYSVVCTGNGYNITFSNVLCVNDAIRTPEELTAISRVDDGETKGTISGYYVLANDLDFADYGTVTPGGNYDNCHRFSGIFHGKNHTIKNISVGECGIFGVLANAYVQNVNFENVKLVSSSNYVALLAGRASGTKIWHVKVQYSEISVRSPENSSYAVYDQGLLFSRSATGSGIELKYVYLDATDLHVPSIFGSEATFLQESVDAGKTNFVETVIYVGSYYVLGYTGSGNSKSGTEITELPDGIQVIKTNCVHVYDNDCDADCNECGETREALHTASWSVQEGKDVYACECGEVSKELITTLTTRQKLDLNWTGIEGTAGSGIYNSLTGQKCNTLSMDLSGIGDWEITSATFDSTKTAGINALSFNGNTIDPTEYGELTYTVTVTLADGSTHSVEVPVLVVTNVITTAEELKGMYITASVAGKGGYFELGNDIEYNGAWTHWATWGYASGYVATLGWANPETAGFQGTFDGCGYAISGLEMNITWGGFITLLGANGTIKNVSFTDAKLTALGGYVCTWGCGTIENVHVQYAAGAYGTSSYAGTFFCADNARSMAGEMTIKDCYIDASAITSKGATMARWIGLASISGTTQSYANLQNVYVKIPTNVSAVTLVTDVENGSEVYTSFSSGYIGLGTVIYAPAASNYYTFAETTVDGAAYAFTVTPTVADLDDFIVLLDGEELTATNGVYTLAELPKGATSIQVLHGYIESGDKVTVEYNGNTVKVTNAVFGSYSDSSAPYMAYISADYINYMISQGYTNVKFNISADNSVAYQACAGWKASNNSLFAYVNDGSVQEITCELANIRDGVLYFWGQNASGSGNTIKDQGGYITITDLTFVK